MECGITPIAIKSDRYELREEGRESKIFWLRICEIVLMVRDPSPLEANLGTMGMPLQIRAILHPVGISFLILRDCLKSLVVLQSAIYPGSGVTNK